TMSPLNSTLSLHDIQRCLQEYEEQLVELRFVQQNIQNDRERCQVELRRQIHEALPALLPNIDEPSIQRLDELLDTACLTKCHEQFGVTLARLRDEIDRINQDAPQETRQQRLAELTRDLAQQVQEHKALSQDLAIYRIEPFQELVAFVDKYGLQDPQSLVHRMRQKIKGVVQRRKTL